MTENVKTKGRGAAWLGILTAGLPGAILLIAGTLLARPYIIKAVGLVLKTVVRR
ncbi:MAG: hypothetical protein IJI21_06660 [Clostridia bacterium]|nr:hypothetical protein [Clostridia bacterium]